MAAPPSDLPGGPPGASAALASRLLGRALAGEREIPVDQTNRSVVVAEQVVVKWLLPPVPAPHPGVELLGHLDVAGFADMPRFLGAEQIDDLVVAIATEFLPGAQDGWDWYVDEMDACLRGEVPIARVLASAQAMGTLTARLHHCAADMQTGMVAARAYHAQAVEQLEQARRALDGEEGELLRTLDGAVMDALSPLDDGQLLHAHRIHGDLHAGQFLRADQRLVITDFDGNPLADSNERRLAHTPLRDVASMVQSIDHVGRIVVKRRHPDRAADVDEMVAGAIAAALDAYGPVQTDVLHALRVAQELHELLYASYHLPRWMYVPVAALPALLGH